MSQSATHQNPQGFTYADAQAVAAQSGGQAIPTFCAMCGPGARCGIYAFVQDGKLQNVAGMAESPINRGSVCPRGQASSQWLYSPDRLTQPLLRKGRRGEGDFVAIPWDEAIGRIADKLTQQKRQYGPESLAVLSPARRNYSEILQRFLLAHGSPNYGHSGICMMQRAFAFGYTIGANMTLCDYPNTDLIILWGRQPIYSGPAMDTSRDLVAAKKRGAKLVAIKPSMEPDAGMSDDWLPVRPGTDGALALAMLHVIIQDGLIDRDFVETWCFGYDALAEHIRQYSPVWAEKICGISADQIIWLARTYAKTPKAVIDIGNGLEHAPSANDTLRTIAMIMAVTGHLDRPGCNLFGGPPQGIPQPQTLNLFERYTPELVNKLVAPEFPKELQPFLEGTSSAYYGIFESILTEDPYPIRTILAPGTQPLVSTRGSRQVIEALKKVDFFVTIDVTRPAEMPYADLVIPTTTSYESDHPFEMQGNWIMARQKIIEPLGNYKSIYEFFIDLGVAMGYGDDFWQGDVEAFQNFQLEPLGMTIDELRQKPIGHFFERPSATPRYEKYQAVFNRPTIRFGQPPYLPQGKVALYNTTFEALGYPPMPVWTEPPESLSGTPDLSAKYQLVLSDYHTSKNFNAGWQRNVPVLRELTPDPTVHIHPDTARIRGIDDGDWVRLESPNGWLKVKAEYFKGIRPDTVMMLHGWWQGCRELGKDDMPLLDGGANVNHLYSTDPKKSVDPLITAYSSQTLVEVSRYEP